MTLAIEVIRDALGHLRVLDANSVPTAVDTSDAIRALNLMLRRWEANGLALGWTDVDNPTDELHLPAEAEDAVGFNLALRLRARYGVAIDPDVIEWARQGLADLRRDRMVEMPLTFDRCYGYYDIRSDGYY